MKTLPLVVQYMWPDLRKPGIFDFLRKSRLLYCTIVWPLNLLPFNFESDCLPSFGDMTRFMRSRLKYWNREILLWTRCYVREPFSFSLFSLFLIHPQCLMYFLLHLCCWSQLCLNYLSISFISLSVYSAIFVFYHIDQSRVCSLCGVTLK